MLRIFLPLFCAASLAAQQSPEDIAGMLNRQRCAESPRAKVCHDNYVVAGAAVEALSFVPAGAGPFPAVLLIPGFQRTAHDLISVGARLADAGIERLQK